MAYDVIIVGSGPAGGMAACELAKKGLKVLILEKERLPRYKACGGGVSAKALQLLDFDVLPACDVEVFRSLVTYRMGEAVTLNIPNSMGWMVMRDRFDHAIVERALAVGAEVRDMARVTSVVLDNGHVSVRVGAETLQASYIIGADGANSIVARSLGLRRRRLMGAALEAEMTLPEAHFEPWQSTPLFDFGGVPLGYAWIFPKREHVSVGVCTIRQKEPQLKKYLLEYFIQGHPDLRHYTSLSVKGHLTPLGGSTETLHKGRALLAGDAAGLADPFVGEGIYYALRSGQLAAQAVAGALSGTWADLAAYTARVNTEIVSDFKYARLFGWLVYHLPRFSFQVLAHSPFVTARFADVLRGDRAYKQLWRGIFRHIPKKLVGI